MLSKKIPIMLFIAWVVVIASIVAPSVVHSTVEVESIVETRTITEEYVAEAEGKGFAFRQPTPKDAHDWGNVPLAGFAIVWLFIVTAAYSVERWRTFRALARIHDKIDEIKRMMPKKDTVEKTREWQIDFGAKIIETQHELAKVSAEQSIILASLAEGQKEIKNGQSENFSRMWDMTKGNHERTV